MNMEKKQVKNKTLRLFIFILFSVIISLTFHSCSFFGGIEYHLKQEAIFHQKIKNIVKELDRNNIDYILYTNKLGGYRYYLFTKFNDTIYVNKYSINHLYKTTSYKTVTYYKYGIFPFLEKIIRRQNFPDTTIIEEDVADGRIYDELTFHYNNNKYYFYVPLGYYEDNKKYYSLLEIFAVIKSDLLELENDSNEWGD